MRNIVRLKGRRGIRLSSRPFYATVFILSLLTAYSFLIHTQLGIHGSNDADVLLSKRKLGGTPKLECSQVHQAGDQCAFVKQYCLDDDAGLLPYLSLYYCNLNEVKPLAFIILVAWLGMLFTTIGIAASEFFSVNLSTIATLLGLSESLAGVTFLAFGNGSPDVFSTFAAMSSNSASMAVGELLGAACFITGVVAGSMALVREFKVDKKTYARDICFFIVAIGFTTFFLADGHLRFWECWVMIGYYVIYVCTVVGQHWYMTRRKRRQRRDGEARSHVYATLGASVDELAGEPYRDDPDDVDNRSLSGPDISALESGPRIEVDGHAPPNIEGEVDEETEEDHERIVAAEVASSMRLLRTRGKRSNTINPIRPSLVGALEFRAALSQLQRESNHRLSSMHGHGRSYSEAHLHGWGQRHTTDAGHRSPHTIAILEEATLATSRSRALSSGDAPNTLKVPSELLRSHYEQPEQHSGTSTPAYTLDGSLAPPPGSIGYFGNHAHTSMGLHLQIPSNRSSRSGGSSPSTPFPPYSDSPAIVSPCSHAEQSELILPGPAIHDRSFVDFLVPVDQPRPVRWWPYSILPPPHILLATFFPTLQGWREKSIWDKVVSTISVPSIFLLVVTLPVADNDMTDGSLIAEDAIIDSSGNRSQPHTASPVPIEHLSIEPEDEWERYRRRSTLSRSSSYLSVRDTSWVNRDDETSLLAPPIQTEQATASPTYARPSSDIPSISNANDETLPWNRWLVCLQVFTGPLFSVSVLWANMREDFESPGKTLVLGILFSLLVSLAFLALLVVLTTEQKRPKYYSTLSFLGFIISIAWISTIAGEVVGVLKTFGVVLGISEALLGLTIFAAGNSVGDLVANITMARLNYPVMAL